MPFNSGCTAHCTCSIVTTSGTLLTAKSGAHIDSADLVLRLGLGPTRDIDQHVGRRTSLRFISDAFAEWWRPISTVPIREALSSSPTRIVWLPVINCFSAVQSIMVSCYPQHRYFTFSNRSHTTLSASRKVWRQLYDAAASALGNVQKVRPTSGFVVVHSLLNSHLCKELRLFGYDDPSPNDRYVQYHYFGKRIGNVADGSGGTLHAKYASARRAPYSLHDFALEHQWLRTRSRGGQRLPGAPLVLHSNVGLRGRPLMGITHLASLAHWGAQGRPDQGKHNRSVLPKTPNRTCNYPRCNTRVMSKTTIATKVTKTTKATKGHLPSSLGSEPPRVVHTG